MQIAGTSQLDLTAHGTQSGAAAHAQCPVPFHSAVERLGERGQAGQSHLVIDESEVECCVVGDEELVRCEKAPDLRGVDLKWVLQAKDPIRKSMNLLGMAVVSFARIEDQVRIRQIAAVFGHSDATETNDAVAFPKSCGLDVAECDGCRNAIQPHGNLLSMSVSAQQHAAHHRNPAEAYRRGKRGESRSGSGVRHPMHAPFNEEVECKLTRWV
jgi:hypothetical protein